MYPEPKYARYSTEWRKILKALEAKGYTISRRYRLEGEDPEAHYMDRDAIYLYKNQRGREVMLRMLPDGRGELYSRIPAALRGRRPFGRNSFFTEMLDALDALDSA